MKAVAKSQIWMQIERAFLKLNFDTWIKIFRDTDSTYAPNAATEFLITRSPDA